MTKREEVVQFLVDLEIDPRVEVGDDGLFLQFCDGDINLALDRLTIDENWVIDHYDKAMDKLNEEIFDPIFEKASETGLTGEDLFITINNLIEVEMCILTKKYDSVELYIAGLMCDG